MALVRVRGISQYMAVVHGVRAVAPTVAAVTVPVVSEPRAAVVASSHRTTTRGFGGAIITPLGTTSRFSSPIG